MIRQPAPIQQPVDIVTGEEFVDGLYVGVLVDQLGRQYRYLSTEAISSNEKANRCLIDQVEIPGANRFVWVQRKYATDNAVSNVR